MPVDLHNLGPESIALLYQAEELSPEERAHVEEMLLRGDTALRDELEKLRAMQGVVEDALARADVSKPLAIPAAAASRRVARAIAQWRVDWLARPTSKPTHKFRWRSLVPAAAAALLLLGSIMFVWWIVSSHDETPVVLLPNEETDPTPLVKNESEDEQARGSEIAQLLAIHTPDESELAAVEQQLSALNDLSNSSQSSREDGVSQ